MTFLDHYTLSESPLPALCDVVSGLYDNARRRIMISGAKGMRTEKSFYINVVFLLISVEQ